MRSPGGVGRAVSVIALLAFGVGEVSAGSTDSTNSTDSAHNDYLLQCQGCHLSDGAGSYAGGMDEIGGVPSLRGSIGRFLSVPGGREYLIRVPGGAQSPLSDAKLAAVLNWMIQEFDPDTASQGFVPFDAQEVTRHRRPLADVESLRSALMLLIASAAPSSP